MPRSYPAKGSKDDAMRNGNTAMSCLFLVTLILLSSPLAWAPQALAAADLLIYTDGLEPGWDDWSWSTSGPSRPNVIGQLLHSRTSGPE